MFRFVLIRAKQGESIILSRLTLFAFCTVFLTLACMPQAKAMEFTSEMGASIIDVKTLEIKEAKSLCRSEPQLVQCDIIKMRIFEDKKAAKRAAKDLKKQTRKNHSHDYRVLTANYQ